MQPPMDNASDREVAVFNAALQLAVEKRAAYLDQACAGDGDLRLRVEALVRVHDEVGTFLENPTQESAPFAAPSGLDEAFRVSTSSIEKTGDRIGRYKLLQQIGEGGCGVVYLAEQQEPVRRKVAVKVIKLGMDTKYVIARFEAERQALALMDHPNIAKVLDAGATDTGRPFFVMELVRGIKITDYCDENQLATEERLKLFTQVCQAIQHAHQKGIIHRDIKPSNILVADHDGVPVPKVIDFGIAKATTDQRLTDKTIFTALEQFIGTPAYMSPEQARLSGLDIDTRTDIYSLGVLLYELLTGKTPFAAKDLLSAGLEEMRRTIREEEPNRPSTALSTMLAADLTTVARQRQAEAPRLVHLVRGDLDWIVMKALEKDRTRRYETANGLAMDVQRHLDNEPVVARPPSNAYRFQKLVHRNKLAVSAVGGVLAALTIGLGLSSWLFLKERQARERAVGAERQAQAARQNEATLRQQAQADEKKAKTEADKSRQVAQFLQQMLKSVGPSVALGRNSTMLREILDQTAESVGKDLKTQPEVEAEMRNTIGEVYDELGEYQKAEAMHREALALRRQLLGEENLAVAESLHNLAQALDHQAKDGEPQVREALRLRRELLGEEHRDVASSLNLLANVQASQGSLAEGEILRREVLGIQRKLHNDQGTGTALNNLANNLLEQGKVAEAETVYRESVATFRKASTVKDKPDTFLPLANLGGVLMKEGKFPEAEIALREALEIRKSFYGDKHYFVASSMSSLAELLQKEGQPAEAEKLFSEVLTPDVEGRPWTSHFLYARGMFHAKLGRFEEAAVDLTRALKYNPDDPDNHWVWYQLAPLLVEQGDLAGYRQYCQSMLARFGATTDPFIADKTAKACLLSPLGGADLAIAGRLTGLAVKAGENLPALPWFQFGKALSEYRQNHFASAAEWAQKVLASALDKRAAAQRDAGAYAMLAMARQQSKNPAEARRALAQAQEILDTKMPKPESGNLASSWYDWLIAQILVREASALIASDSAAGTRTK